MRIAPAALSASRLLGTLLEERLPAIGFLHAFPDAFGLPPAGGGPPKQKVGPDELQRKVDVLLRSGEETRAALGLWRELEERHLEPPQDVLLAIEDAALSLRQAVLLGDEDAINFDDLDAPAPPPEQVRRECEAQLDGLAAKVARAAPADLFPGAGGGTGPDSGTQADADLGRRQLSHLAEELHGRQRFRQEPYEWVYDGLRPLLLDGVLQTREGMPASLAALYCCVARRLACPLRPRTAPAGGSDFAVIQAGLSLASAPTPDPWLVEVSHPGMAADCLLKPTTGELLTQAEASKQFPGLQQAATSTPLPFWRGLLRVAMTAHQRRGDGDAVAHCMHQLLALDPQAPEWESALRPAAIRR